MHRQFIILRPEFDVIDVSVTKGRPQRKTSFREGERRAIHRTARDGKLLVKPSAIRDQSHVLK
jgi:hypothetical protein